MRLRGPSTLRGRVVLGSVAALALALAALVLVFNVLLAGSLRSDVNSRLESRAAAALTTVAVEDARVVPQEGPGDAALDSGVWVFQGTRAVERPPAAADVDQAAAALARSGGRFAETTDASYRLHAVPIRDGGREVGRVVVATSLAAYDRTTDLALIGSLLFALAVLGAVATVLWVAVGRALHPVEAMTGQAADWGAHDLDRRFGDDRRPHELKRLAATFDGLLDRVAASLRHEQRLSAELSHELRTPLAQIAAQADLLSRRPHDADEQRAAAELTLRSTGRMEAILDTLMTAARAEARPSPGVCDASEAVRNAVDAVADGAREHGVEVTVRSSPAERIGADGELVERTLIPLLDNAQRFARTSISVVARREGQRVLVDIQDDGPGIALADLEAVFAPGVRFSDAAAGHDGAGLGLALSRRLARTAGGDVRAIATDTGAHLQVQLPAA